ncbi:MAG: sigma-70 family RNA polymerase sigma factor, partial [Terrimicrobiaceae bacterium]
PLYSPGRGRPMTWAVTLTRNKAIDLLRATRRRGCLQDNVQQELETFEQFDDRSSFNAVTSAETSKLVRDAMQKLSKDQREAIELAFFSSMTQTEIAERLNAPLGTIKARIRRGMMTLRDMIGPQL